MLFWANAWRNIRDSSPRLLQPFSAAFGVFIIKSVFTAYRAKEPVGLATTGEKHLPLLCKTASETPGSASRRKKDETIFRGGLVLSDSGTNHRWCGMASDVLTVWPLGIHWHWAFVFMAAICWPGPRGAKPERSSSLHYVKA